jgi:hypothetical protein
MKPIPQSKTKPSRSKRVQAGLTAGEDSPFCPSLLTVLVLVQRLALLYFCHFSDTTQHDSHLY